jgi:hypothetical protein
VLTVLQEKLGEAHGLGIAAEAAIGRVEARLPGNVLREELDGMRLDAEELRGRCLAAERSFGEDAALQILAHANATSEKAADLAGAWFKAGTGPLAAWSFLAMGEAAEVTTWAALVSFAARDGDDALLELASWGLEVQERHLRVALEGAVRLAETTDPAASRWG